MNVTARKAGTLNTDCQNTSFTGCSPWVILLVTTCRSPRRIQLLNTMRSPAIEPALPTMKGFPEYERHTAEGDGHAQDLTAVQVIAPDQQHGRKGPWQRDKRR